MHSGSRAVKRLSVVEEFSRKALAMEAERRIDADKLVDGLEWIVAERGRHRSSCAATTGRR